MSNKVSNVAYWLASFREFDARCCFIRGLVVLMVCQEKKSKVVAVECLLMRVWTGALGEEIMSLYNDSSAQWWYILLHWGLQSRTNPRNSVCVYSCWIFSVCCFYLFESGWGKGWRSMNVFHSISTYQGHFAYINAILLVMILFLVVCVSSCGFVFVPFVEYWLRRDMIWIEASVDRRAA